MKDDDEHITAGGQMKRDTTRLEQVCDEVQALNRAAGNWFDPKLTEGTEEACGTEK